MFEIGSNVKHKDRIGVITGVYAGVSDAWNVSFDGGGYGAYYSKDLILIKMSEKPSIKEKFTLAFKKEPEKSFRKSGITNGDDYLTEDGQQIFLGWLLKKHGEEFKTDVVDDLLKDECEDK